MSFQSNGGNRFQVADRFNGRQHFHGLVCERLKLVAILFSIQFLLSLKVKFIFIQCKINFDGTLDFLVGIIKMQYRLYINP